MLGGATFVATERLAMADRPSKVPGMTEGPVAVAGSGLVPQLRMMAQAFRASPQRRSIQALGIATVIVVSATAYGQIRLNAWNQPFFDALSRKDLAAFGEQLVVFAVIAGLLLVLNVAQIWLNQMTKVKLREGLVRDLFGEWLKPKRAFCLASAGEIGANPDQRIHEDARHLTELSTDLGIGLLQASLLLVSFVDVLWILSQSVTFHVSGQTFAIPGYMVWCALAYAAAASWLSWRVGRPLIGLNAERYGHEAELRFELVRVNEHADSIAIHSGEADERRRLNAEFDHVLAIMRQIVGALTRLTWITAGYGWFTIVAPIIVAAPGYFSGNLSFGGLMMAVGAFNQVQQALRWFVDNFSVIADWRATFMRVASFRQSVVALEEFGAAASQITHAEASGDKLVLDALAIASPTGCIRLSEPLVEIGRGERVLIVGQPGAGKTLLFRAIAGLWPWGTGRIVMPASSRIMFVSRYPYVPPGTLRAAVAYPAPPTAHTDAELIAALEATGLGRLSPALDQNARWDRNLTDDEQQALAFARLVVRKPEWVIIDEALDALDPEAHRRVMTIFRENLPDAAIINIGRPEGRDHFFTRALSLVKDPAGMSFGTPVRPDATPHRPAHPAREAIPGE